MLKGKRIGIAITGSFCMFDAALEVMEALVGEGAILTFILSPATNEMDTKFGTAEDFREKLEKLSPNPLIRTIPEAEPIGPKKLLDALIVLPATGNTMAKLAAGITDTPTTMAVKSHLRNGSPVVIGISSNDALGMGAKNIGHLLASRNIYFIPFGQDDAMGKPRSMVFSKEHVIPAVQEALKGRQVQPLLI
ncbi:MAG: dipicolinate synthase subunit B [Defluviitaleaceae bacterium]|nr:dipicolinate synthase subunit B [Defluviitaleaceae bacterium]